MVPQIIFQQNGNNFDMIRSNYIRRGVLALCMFIMTMAAWAQHDSDSLKNDFSKHHQQDNYRKNLHGDKFKQTQHLGEVVVRGNQVKLSTRRHSMSWR